MGLERRDIFLKIEALPSYSPIAPIAIARRYGWDYMLNQGHEYGRVPADEILDSTINALVYREYLDPQFTVPATDKIVEADLNEPAWDRRIPGAVLYARPGQRLYIHVLNGDPHKDHGFQIQGLSSNVASGRSPSEVDGRSGGYSDRIPPGERRTYVYDLAAASTGGWIFYEALPGNSENLERGLFGGLLVRDATTTYVDHEVVLFVHQLSGISKVQFQSPRLALHETFNFKFENPGTIHYYCRVHGPTMNGTVHVVAGGPESQSVTIKNHSFDPQIISIAPGGVVLWKNSEENTHIVFSPGGGAANLCLNGRTFAGNTPTIATAPGETLRWNIFNIKSLKGELDFPRRLLAHPTPSKDKAGPAGGSQSPFEYLVAETKVPAVMSLPSPLEEYQNDPDANACWISLKGDFPFRWRNPEQELTSPVGLLRVREHIWINDDLLKGLENELPLDDDVNIGPTINVEREQVANRSAASAGEAPETQAASKNTLGMKIVSRIPSRPAGVGELATKGVWELLPGHAPLLPVHAILLHTGRILFFAGSGNDELYTTGLRSAVWDYTNGEWISPFTPVDFLCAGHSLMADGRVLVAGGTKSYDKPGALFVGLENAYCFDPLSEQWIRLQSMSAGGRWYPTLVTLGDGTVFTVSGVPDDSKGLSPATGWSDRAEIYSSVTGWRQLPRLAGWPLYPHVFLLLDGRLFFTGGNIFNSGILQPGILDLATNVFTPVELPQDFEMNHRDHSASVLLAPAQDQKIMIMGGGDPAIDKAHLIDFKSSKPVYTPRTPLYYARLHSNAVLLPDRTVLVAGGNGESESVPTAVLESEIYHPDTNTWTLAATMNAARMYHSIALLMPDGRVLAAGSNANRRDDDLRLEIFHPPYLFRGPRPFIETAPMEIQYGSTIVIRTPQARNIKWVELIRPMCTTHSVDTGQRIVDASFEATSLCELRAQMPGEQNLAPPGWYMLFVVSKDGIPSVAKWVHLTGGPTPNHEPAVIKQTVATYFTGGNPV